jgi:hypothetical protein
MAEQMIKLIASPVRNPLVLQPWCGNIGGNGFWNVENPNIGEHAQYERLSMCMPGQYYKSHSVYQQVFANFINMCGYGAIFMYRDLRDCAVSWAHHAMNPDTTTHHPAKQYFRLIGSFEEALLNVIEGVGPLPGIVEHWADFAPWLDQDWILPIRYEDMRTEPEETAEKIVLYMIDRTSEIREEEFQISAKASELFKEMADATRNREASPTFRKGVVGGWKEEFTDEAMDAFIAHGGNEWLEELGYGD